MSSPSCLKNPWSRANSMNDEFQNPRCATATFSVSAAARCAAVMASRPMATAMILRMAFPRIFRRHRAAPDPA